MKTWSTESQPKLSKPACWKLKDFSPARIIPMKPELVGKIAAESLTTGSERTTDLKADSSAGRLDRCKKHVGRPMTSSQTQPPSLQCLILVRSSTLPWQHEGISLRMSQR